MKLYIESSKLCNVLSRMDIVFKALLLDIAPLKRQVNITLYFECLSYKRSFSELGGLAQVVESCLC